MRRPRLKRKTSHNKGKKHIGKTTRRPTRTVSRRIFFVVLGFLILAGQIYLSARIFTRIRDNKNVQDRPIAKKTKKIANNKAVANSPILAIIIDDVGYNRDAAERLVKISPQLTFSIIPELPLSGELARMLQARGAEIMCHLPMEPKGGNLYPTENPLLLSMTDKEIGSLALRKILSLPGIAGVNNHTGSLFTENERGMRIVLGLLKEKNLYFIDSRTTVDTIAYKLASEIGLKTYMNDLFLDGEDDELKIWDKWNNLIELALSEGKALGIGHARPITIKVLAEELPRLKKKGVTLVPVSVFLERK